MTQTNIVTLPFAETDYSTFVYCNADIECPMHLRQCHSSIDHIRWKAPS